MRPYRQDPGVALEFAGWSHSQTRGRATLSASNTQPGQKPGFRIFVGVGYKAQAKGQLLELSLGFSHNIYLQLPQEIKVETVTERGKNPTITLTSYDKQLIGQVAAKIRSLRKPEPYKGKGVKYQGEYLRRKAGKAAAEK